MRRDVLHVKMTANPSETDLEGQTCVSDTTSHDDTNSEDNLEDENSISSEALSILNCFASVELPQYAFSNDVCDKVMFLQSSNNLHPGSFNVSANNILTPRDSESLIQDTVTTDTYCDEEKVSHDLDVSIPQFIRSVPSPEFLTELDGSYQEKTISLNHGLANLNSNSEEPMLTFSENDDLYLECTDDLQYFVPFTPAVASGHSIVAKNINLKISFSGSIDNIETDDNLENVRYRCPLCPRTFANENWMKQHFVDSHQQIARFNCNHCSFYTHSNRNLLRHVRRQHLTRTNSKCQSSLSKHNISCVYHEIDSLLDNNLTEEMSAIPLTDKTSKISQPALSATHATCYESNSQTSVMHPTYEYLDGSTCTYNQNMQSSDINSVILGNLATCRSISPADLCVSTDKDTNISSIRVADSLPLQIPLDNLQKCIVGKTALNNTCIGITGPTKRSDTNRNKVSNMVEDSVIEVSNSMDACACEDLSNPGPKHFTSLCTQSEPSIVPNQKNDAVTDVTLFTALHSQSEGHRQPPLYPSMCEQCHKQFSTKSCLQRHIVRFHRNGLKTFKCDENGCDKAFRLQANLTAHKNKVHKRKLRLRLAACTERAKDLIPNCNTCILTGRAEFRNYSGKFKCSTKNCGKTFRDKYSLDEHECIHSGIMLRKCLLCNYECIQKSSLNFHIRTCHVNCTSVVFTQNANDNVSATNTLFVDCYVNDDNG